MPDPIKMPAPPLAPGQVEVKLGAKRYVLNVPESGFFVPDGAVEETTAEKSGLLAFPSEPEKP